MDDAILTVFGVCTRRSTGVKRVRVAQIEVGLRAYLEAGAADLLTAEELTLLAAEREFAPEGAACRLFSSTLLTAALPGFLMPPYLVPDFLLREAQLSMVGAFIDFLVPANRYDHGSDRLRTMLRRTLAEAMQDLKRERQAQSLERLLGQLSAEQLEHMERLRRDAPD
ncbi:hypothetical protein [Cryobacterium sp. PAMC25264]|uniref:hypothetical protein n=1 Tax=Cryobacterium sp. PAMC25264 TaxID=2861288 RepID=UPI001C637653|nr:hypothetical protein [Cryobacterium sp. PAMC25264]QYF72563.1 hypothetical protein KY500_12080 [Cryobacterium sp. PAMC25264]